MFVYRGCSYFNMYVLDKTNQLIGNVYNYSKVTIKVKEDLRSRYAKYVFLLGKINSVILSLVLSGLSLLTEMTYFPTLSYTLYSEICTLFYTCSLKKVALSRGLPWDKKRHM